MSPEPSGRATEPVTGTGPAPELSWRRYERQRDAHAAMLDDIAAARRSVDIEQFIFADDPVGARFVEALAGRAAEGLRVRVLVDAVGSHDLLASGAPARLREAGADFRVFLRPRRMLRHRPAPPWRRDHRKILVTDGMVAHVGGIALSQRMADWRDVDLRLTGGIVAQVADAFDTFWHGETSPRPAPSPPIDAGTVLFLSTHAGHRSNPVYDHLLDALDRAERQVSLTTPYFVPARGLRRAIAAAVRRGVEVRLLVPEEGDHLPADLITWSAAVRVMRDGARVFTRPEMMHGKVQVIDDAWASVGSSNLDPLSFFGNEEGDLIARRADLATELRRAIDRDLAQSDPLTEARWSRRGAIKRLAAPLFRPLRPFL